MKRLGVAGYITRYNGGDILLGRRSKDPNRGLYVLPGGGVKEGETLEQALIREIAEETGYQVLPNPSRWDTVNLIELDDRIVLVARVNVINHNDEPIANSDIHDVAWFNWGNMPFDEISPVIQKILVAIKKNESLIYTDPYQYKFPSPW